MLRPETWIAGAWRYLDDDDEEYVTAPRLKRFAYRIYRNPFILFGLGSALLFLSFQRFSKKDSGKCSRKRVIITNLVLLFLIVLAASTIALRTYLKIQLPVIAIGSGIGLLLF